MKGMKDSMKHGTAADKAHAGMMETAGMMDKSEAYRGTEKRKSRRKQSRATKRKSGRRGKSR